MELNTKIAMIATAVVVTAVPAAHFIKKGNRMIANAVEQKRAAMKTVVTLANTLTA